MIWPAGPARHVVGVGDLRVACAGEALVTFALGSCIGVAIVDPVAGVGGMLHAMLPTSAVSPDRAESRPAMFVDTGVPLLFQEAYRAGARRERIILKVAGGASIHGPEGEDHFQIGKRNVLMLRKLLWKNQVLVRGQDVGGRISRDLFVDPAAGTVAVRTGGETRLL